MLEDQVAYLLQRYLGNYVKGLSKEALKISVWQGDVELSNMQLKPEALNALNLPVKVKAGFLGSVKLKVPWSSLGQDPVIVYLDRIFLLAEPATQVEGSSEDAVQEKKKSQIKAMETKLLESKKVLNTEMNKTWLGSLINKIIGNVKLSISNVHIRYEDIESHQGHPFAGGVTLEKISAMTVDDEGKETFVTDGGLERIQKSVELERLAVYFDSNVTPWRIDKKWEDLSPLEWAQIFKFGTKDGKPSDKSAVEHSYILQPVTGNAKYIKQRPSVSMDSGQPLQKAVVNLDDVTLCLSKNGYRDLLKLADNFAAFSQRLKFSHYRPHVTVKSNPRAWWKYAYRAVSDQVKKTSGKLSWERVLRYARLRKDYISLYASLLIADPERLVIDDDKDIKELDRELEIELIIQWRMMAHKFVEQSTGLETYKKQKETKPWWSFGWGSQPVKGEAESGMLTEDDWERLNKFIGYKEVDDEQLLAFNKKKDVPHMSLEVHMKHNASKLTDSQVCLADLSCDNLECFIKLYAEAKVFDIKLGSYRLLSPNGLLAESATSEDSIIGTYRYKPFDSKVDWSMVAKASPCYVTYLKDSIDEIVNFFESNTAVSHTIALETAAALQMTIDEVKRTAQQQVNRTLKDYPKFHLDLDIAAPKITIPSEFCPDGSHPTKLLLDLGNLIINTKDNSEDMSSKEASMYFQFDLMLSDVSAFLVDGDYHWSQVSSNSLDGSPKYGVDSFLPVIDRCGVFLNLQQCQSDSLLLPSTRIALRLPSLGFHFSPARYHRLMQVAKVFQGGDGSSDDLIRPWNQADFEGWLSLLIWKGVGGREAVWQRRYICIAGPVLYVLEEPGSKSYEQYLSLRGKQLFQVPSDIVSNIEHVIALCDSEQSSTKVLEDASAVILRCESEDSRKTWQSYLRGAIYRASGSAPITGFSESSSDSEESESGSKHLGNQDVIDFSNMEKVFLTGALDELRISFNYSSQELSFMKTLLAEEKRLFEFRATGGRVEVLMKGNDIFIGSVLKALEIEDLVCCKAKNLRCYVARSFIRNADAPPLLNDSENRSSQSELEDDDFYEASENLNDSIDSPQYIPQTPFQTPRVMETPSFNRIPGLLPLDDETEQIEDSFVKAQIVIYDQNSSLYTNIDKKVTLKLATLTFYCRRPMIMAILKFVNAITIEEESCDSFSDSSSAAIIQRTTSKEGVTDGQSQTLSRVEEPVMKGLLGKGKSRIVFYLTLKMARAQILLMKENGSKLATLSMDNFLTEIKVFPSSFSIKASLGNLRISDDSLLSNHMYFWACDMRNFGGSSFVELMFSSFSSEDDDYEGYEYSFIGQLSEVRIVYLNRFIQEIISYFMGLVPQDSNDIVKIKDQVSNSEKWFTKSEIEGSPAIKLDISLKKPIILMPQRTDSVNYLKLDVVHITVKNSFRWVGGNRRDINAIHMDIMTIQVEDINLNVGAGTDLGESIIQNVKGVSINIQRALRDLLHQIPSIEVAIRIVELKAALSNREYEIITECAQSNFSETPNLAPSLEDNNSLSQSRPIIPRDSDTVNSETLDIETWITTKVSVIIDLVELSLHQGQTRDASLATVQVSGFWLLYKARMSGEGLLSSTLEGFTVIDDREGTEQELRVAMQKPKVIIEDDNVKLVPTMLILDAKFNELSTFLSLCIQRPQMLVSLDFLLAVVEFFVPTIRNTLLNEDDVNSPNILEALILDQPVFTQPCPVFTLSPLKPLIADDDRFDEFTYDGKGGTLYLYDKKGLSLSSPSLETIIYVGSGKKLRFKNVTIKNGFFLDSCISLGSNSSYSTLEGDKVFFEADNAGSSSSSQLIGSTSLPTPSPAVNKSSELILEFQAIGPELTFYNRSENVVETFVLTNKLLHCRLDAFCRLVLKGDSMEMNASALGFTMESNGIRILEPFDTKVKFSNDSGRTSITLSVSDVFVNFSISILQLFLAVEEDILSFLRMTSKKMTMVCSEFDKIGTIKNPSNDQIYAFWRARAPTGFAVLGDYLTPIDKPPTKGVVAVNTSFVRVKRPESFTLVWAPEGDSYEKENVCSIWLPEAPKGYVAMGCVVTPGKTQPPLTSCFCILASLVSVSALRDCVHMGEPNPRSNLAFWRVDNSIGTFLPADPTDLTLIGRAYELRQMFFGFPEISSEMSKSTGPQAVPSTSDQLGRTSTSNSERRFEIATFQLIWWNQGSGSSKRLSIWRPIVTEGMVHFGDIAVQGYEPPNRCIVLHDSPDDELYKPPSDFQLVGQIKKYKRMDPVSFYMPQAPPGYVPLGYIACKGTPKVSDFSSLRCIRSDMVIGDQFSEESFWDTSELNLAKEPFSIWIVDKELGTFIVRSGFKKPPRRFALKLADPDITTTSDTTVIDAEIRTFSISLFDDYGGLMIPLWNFSFSSIGCSLRGRPDYLNTSASLSMAIRSYNDHYESWEPMIEQWDGLLRYQYNHNNPGVASQLRVTGTKELLVDVSVSNVNAVLQAYSSWNNLILVQGLSREKNSPKDRGGSVIDVYHEKTYHIIPVNKLGQDIFIRASERRGLANIIKMPAGDTKPVKVPVSKNMLDSHFKGHLRQKPRKMVTIIISEAEFLKSEGLQSREYALTVRVLVDPNHSGGSQLNNQNARTRGLSSDGSESSQVELVKWNEAFFFKVDQQGHYILELTVIDIGRDETIGSFSAPLDQIPGSENDSSSKSSYQLTWLDLTSPESETTDEEKKKPGRVRCAVVMSSISESPNPRTGEKKSGVIQISPTREGPWTTVRLNYAAPAACWRLGNDVVASELTVHEGDRYVYIRSMVSVRNNTEFTLDLCLTLKASDGNRSYLNDSVKEDQDDIELVKSEYFETEKYTPSNAWISSGASQEAELPRGWEWIDEWNIDTASVNTNDGWVYAPDFESLKWPESYNPLKHVNYARQRRWVRNRKQISGDHASQITVGSLKPGELASLPLSVLTKTGSYVLQLRPSDEYSWSEMDKRSQSHDVRKPNEAPGIYVASLFESEELLYCSAISGTSSNSSQSVWFCLSIRGSEIAKDAHSDPIQDWTITVKSPLSITNYLPLQAEYSVMEMRPDGHLHTCSRGIFKSGENVNVYNADSKNPLYFSLIPQGGWQPLHETVIISHPTRAPSKTMILRSSISGRIAQLIIEHNQTKESIPEQKIISISSPYWISIARCPPLTFRLQEIGGKKRKHSLPFQSKKNEEPIYQEITMEEISEGYTIASALNLKMLNLRASISESGEEEHFGPIKGLAPLAEMDGSLEDLCAYNADGNSFRLFVSSKPCTYTTVPTKVICVRPYMTFTNRLGENLYLKLSTEDQPKILSASDVRVSFVSNDTDGPSKLQVRLNDTYWSVPIEINKEDTISLVLKKHDGTRKLLRLEIRAYEEGSRFIVVFRLGSTLGPIRVENRTRGIDVKFRQSGFSDDDAWVHLLPLSTVNFAWNDPYGEKFIDVEIRRGTNFVVSKLDMDNLGLSPVGEGLGLFFLVVNLGEIKIARFVEERSSLASSNEENWFISHMENWELSQKPSNMEQTESPLELILDLASVGFSIIDHKPKELCYLYLERVSISYSTGYDGGKTSRFKLMMGYIQLDNQLPLTLMPVMLAPDQTSENHPVFKMTITVRNEDLDGVQVYPYFFIRVSDKTWRINIHEPIIWALVDFYNSLHLDRIDQGPNVTQADPEIRIDLIDISEMRLKISLETAPAQRPHGVLGVWSPILSAIGNAFKVQVHLRKVTRTNRFMRKSAVVASIGNRMWRDLIHNPLHLIFSVDVFGVASSTLASLSKGFAELSTDGQFLQLRSKQGWSRRINGVGDGIMQGTEALAQGFAFGVAGVVTKPVESARQNGILGLAHGLGRAFLGIVVQPVSGALDFVSLTVDGIGASCSRCLEILSNKTKLERIRNPRAMHIDNILGEYSDREALGQMILYLAEESRHFGCTEIFKEPSKFAFTDYYQDHFLVPYHRIVLVTSKRVMLLQSVTADKLDKKPCKIMWDVPWEELMALELAKAGFSRPSHLILHLKNFERAENFVRVIKCNNEEELNGREPQAVRICHVVRKMWKSHQSDVKSLILKVPSSQRNMSFAWPEDPRMRQKAIFRSRQFSSSSSTSDDQRLTTHSVNFVKIWTSELEAKGRCTLCRKQVSEDNESCSIWRPICPDGYVTVGDIARPGAHPPTVAAIYRNYDKMFSFPVGYDLVWRNCIGDYVTPVSIWYPRAPEGYVSLGCVAVAGFEEPEPNSVYCVAEILVEETTFEVQKIWSAPGSYPWACHIYQVQSEALHFVALRQPREDSDWKTMRVVDDQQTSNA